MTLPVSIWIMLYPFYLLRFGQDKSTSITRCRHPRTCIKQVYDNFDEICFYLMVWWNKQKFLLDDLPFTSLMRIVPERKDAITVWCRYNTVNFLKNNHKRHPIAHLIGQGLLWIQDLIDILPEFLLSIMQYLTMVDRFITALDWILNAPTRVIQTCQWSICDGLQYLSQHKAMKFVTMDTGDNKPALLLANCAETMMTTFN